MKSVVREIRMRRSVRGWEGDLPLYSIVVVIPVKTGIQSIVVELDPGFRRGDGTKKRIEFRR